MNEQRIPTFGIREATSALLLWVTLMLVGIQCCIAISPAGKVVGTYLPQVEPGTGFTNVAAGDYFTVLQDDAGRLYVVGNGPVIPPGLSNVVGLAAGGSHVLALRNDGSVSAWGDNSFGQTNVPAGLSNVVAVSAGAGHSLALLGDGTLIGWGSDYLGISHGPPGTSNIIAISAGGSHNLAPLSVSGEEVATASSAGA